MTVPESKPPVSTAVWEMPEKVMHAVKCARLEPPLMSAGGVLQAIRWLASDRERLLAALTEAEGDIAWYRKMLRLKVESDPLSGKPSHPTPESKP